jgi:hypothetical protein
MMFVLGMPHKWERRPDDWTEAQDEIIRGWKAAGWSSSQMATRLGVTKNAVIGRMNRLKKRNDWTPHVPSAPYVAPEPVKAPVEPVKATVRPHRTVASKPQGLCRFGTCKATRLRPYEFCAAHMPGRAA